MHAERYNIKVADDALTFEFVSIGPKGEFTKIVVYQHIDGNLYNLAFGDSNGKLGFIDDLVITDNKDTIKVLATVASTIFEFFNVYEGTIVLAKGSTQSRTRLYRRHLSIFLDIINEDFILLGEREGKVERFQKDKDYTSFYITKLI